MRSVDEGSRGPPEQFRWGGEDVSHDSQDEGRRDGKEVTGVCMACLLQTLSCEKRQKKLELRLEVTFKFMQRGFLFVFLLGEKQKPENKKTGLETEGEVPAQREWLVLEI